jgi:hypothetical protein
VRFRFLCVGILAAASLEFLPQAHASLVHSKLGDPLPNTNVHAGGGSSANGASDGANHNGSGNGGGNGGFGGSFIGGGSGGGFGGGGGGGRARTGNDNHGIGGPRAGGNADELGGPGDGGPNQLVDDGDFPAGGFPNDGHGWDPSQGGPKNGSQDGDPSGTGWPDGPGGGGPGYPGSDGPTLFFADPLGDLGNTRDALTSVDDPIDVPEPSSLALLTAALLGLGVMDRRKSRLR